MKVEKQRTLELRKDFEVLNVDNGSDRSQSTKDKISKSMAGSYNGGDLKWTEETLKKAAGIKIYTRKEFTEKYSDWAAYKAKQLGINKEIFK